MRPFGTFCQRKRCVMFSPFAVRGYCIHKHFFLLWLPVFLFYRFVKKYILPCKGFPIRFLNIHGLRIRFGLWGKEWKKNWKKVGPPQAEIFLRFFFFFHENRFFHVFSGFWSVLMRFAVSWCHFRKFTSEILKP